MKPANNSFKCAQGCVWELDLDCRHYPTLIMQAHLGLIFWNNTLANNLFDLHAHWVAGYCQQLVSTALSTVSFASPMQSINAAPADLKSTHGYVLLFTVPPLQSSTRHQSSAYSGMVVSYWYNLTTNVIKAPSIWKMFGNEFSSCPHIKPLLT